MLRNKPESFELGSKPSKKIKLDVEKDPNYNEFEGNSNIDE